MRLAFNVRLFVALGAPFGARLAGGDRCALYAEGSMSIIANAMRIAMGRAGAIARDACQSGETRVGSAQA